MTDERTEENWEGPAEDVKPDEIEGQQEQPEPAQTSVATIPKARLVKNERGYIEPSSVEEAARMARAVIVGGFAPDSYKVGGVFDPNKIMLGIMSAMEAGLPPLYGLRQIAIINGRPSIWGDGAIALVQSKNLIEKQEIEKIGTIPESADLSKWPDDYGYCVRFKRRNQEGWYEGTFTVGHAKRAKLWLNAKKVPWLEHPERMLFNRARAFALRDGFADALGGIAIREELEDTFEAEDTKHLDVDLSDAPKVEVPDMPSEEEPA